jgi:uncharacterized RDD family membrane protein YckC
MSDPLDLRGDFAIETPEQVSFRLERAGLGSRILAAAIDTAILAALYFFVLIALGVAGAFLALADDPSKSSVWAIALMIALVTLLSWGYYIGFELAWNGQSPGKRLLGIRVVGDGGVPVAPGQVVVRNLVRFVDMQLAYAVGMIAIFATKEEKRLGDLAAGTVVVSERRERRAAGPRGRATPSGRALDPDLLDVLRDYWARSPELDAATRWRIARDLANRLAEDLGREPVPSSRVEAELKEMTEIALGEGWRRGKGAPGDT